MEGGPGGSRGLPVEPALWGRRGAAEPRGCSLGLGELGGDRGISALRPVNTALSSHPINSNSL